MGDPSARRRPSQICRGCGFVGSITQAAGQNKRALGPDKGWGLSGFASGGCGAYLGASNRSDFMSAAEQLEDGQGGPPPHRDPLMEAEAVIEELEQSPAKGGAKLRPLLALAPYVMRYRGRAFLAFIS